MPFVPVNFRDLATRRRLSSAFQEENGADDGLNLPSLMQMNGRKVLSPPKDWVGPPPTSACELFVRRIPRNLNEQKLIQPFLRFGRIYEIRVPMDFNQGNRGYAYIKYANEDDAACAMEVLSHYYVAPHRKLEIVHSYEKCRLFVSNIPREIDEAEIEEKFRIIFPTMQRIYTRGGPRYNGDNGVNDYDNHGRVMNMNQHDDSKMGNRGHVFVHFPSHLHALEAKRNTTPGIIRMWGNDLRVVWANTEREIDVNKETKTLFIRNVDLSVNNRDIIDMMVQYIPRTNIRKISKVRSTAFVDFTTRESAKMCLQQLQGTMLHGQRLELEWAKPSEQQSLHRMRNTDFDAILRLKCMANGWNIPIIIFGTYFELEGYQYGAIMLRDRQGLVRAIFCIMQPHELVDIHSRMCEVACVLIETIGSFPDYNYVFFVQKDNAHLLGMVTHNVYQVDFIPAYRVPPEFFFDFNELVDLSWAVASLAPVCEGALLQSYQESFQTHNRWTYMRNCLVLGHRIFGTIMPKYRNKAPLKFNLNDTQVVLALCFISTGTNCALPHRPFVPFPANNFNGSFEVLRYVTLKLLPIALTQSRFGVSHMLSHIPFGGSLYYHPAQRIMLPPIWINVCPYSVCVKQPPTEDERKHRSQQQQQRKHLQQLQQLHQIRQQQQLRQLHQEQRLQQQRARQRSFTHSPCVSSNNSSNQSTAGGMPPNNRIILATRAAGAFLPGTALHLLHS